MKILIISPKVPYPPMEGATLRIFNIVRELSKKNEIHLLSFARTADVKSDIGDLARTCETNMTVRLNRTKYKKYWQLFTSPLRKAPYLFTVHETPQMRNIINDIGHRFDAVQAEFPYTAQYITDLPVMKVLDQHNVESEILRLSFWMEKNWAKRVYHYFQYRKMEVFESRICGQMDTILATSDDDKKSLSILNPNVMTIPNAVSEVAERAEDRANKTITFTGLMSYGANVDAMEYFAKQIWPLIRVSEPEARLFIVGRNPGRQVLKLKEYGATITGSVPDINTYIREASVIIAPLRIGSGTRIKILEAMAHGKPVVSSSLGCMGLKVAHGENILIADEPDMFADCVLNLLADRGERMRIGSAGLELIKNLYTWEKACQGLKEVYGD